MDPAASSATPSPTVPPDSRRARAEERLAMLRELSEIGMQAARALGRRMAETLEAPAADAPAADAASPPGPDLTPQLSRVARMVRMTLALEARLERDLDEAHRKQRQIRAWRAALDGFRPQCKPGEVPRIVERLVESEADPDDMAALLDEMSAWDEAPEPRQQGLTAAQIDAIKRDIMGIAPEKDDPDGLEARPFRGSGHGMTGPSRWLKWPQVSPMSSNTCHPCLQSIHSREGRRLSTEAATAPLLPLREEVGRRGMLGAPGRDHHVDCQ
jgi:hypothetical protein